MILTHLIYVMVWAVHATQCLENHTYGKQDIIQSNRACEGDEFLT